MLDTRISEIGRLVGQTVRLQGWVANLRSSGSIVFIQFRDGTGLVQVVVAKDKVPAEVFTVARALTIESSIKLEGTVAKDERAPGGFEISGTGLEIIQVTEDYPIGKKAHGPDFLLDERHLWLRAPRQQAILKIRDAVIWALRSYLHDQGFILTDSPILTPNAVEGTTTLFKTDYFGAPAYLAQTGQLYIEATAAALGRVYDFGPTFRAEKSKTRRHLIEFWMLDVEAAFMDFEQSLQLQEQLLTAAVQYVLTHCSAELKILERDVSRLEKIQAPFPRLTYHKAIEKLKAKGIDIKSGADLGADEETALSQMFDQPVFITHYPAKIKAFYMQPDPADPTLALNNDLLAPEGYGEIIGGSQRIDDFDLLKKRIADHKLPLKEFEWYLDLRRYGTFPHSGFGLGLERTVAWICGLKHVREAIPFPRLINRLRP